jgi:hypothetical protein
MGAGGQVNIQGRPVLATPLPLLPARVQNPIYRHPRPFSDSVLSHCH